MHMFASLYVVNFLHTSLKQDQSSSVIIKPEEWEL